MNIAIKLEHKDGTVSGREVTGPDATFRISSGGVLEVDDGEGERIYYSPSVWTEVLMDAPRGTSTRMA